MDCNRDEAIRAIEVAENKLQSSDFEGARKLAMKASKLYPGVDKISRLLAVCDVLFSAQNNVIDDAKDWYGILQVERQADEATIKKQYRKLALLLHPDKNKCTGAETAFKLVGEANAVLLDREKRSSYDRRCRASASPTTPKPPAHQSAFNRHSDSHETFWTVCPFCKFRFQYYVQYINKIMRCQNCLQPFTARDSNPQGAAQESKQATASGSEGVGTGSFHFATETTSSVEGKRKERVDTSDTNQMSKEEVIIEQSESKHAPHKNAEPESTSCRRSSRQKANVSYNEDLMGDYFETPAEGSGESKSKEDKKKKRKATDERVISEPKFENIDHDQKLDTATEVSKCPDPEFSDFDKNRDEKSFAANQIWACYDSVDGMPRFYAHIRKVYSPFKVRFTWLEPVPEEPKSIDWVNGELPMASGRFMKGGAEETLNRLTFSHQIQFKKGQRGFYFVYPQKGETWALYRNWSIEWSSDPQSHKPFSFEVVEIISDFHQETGIEVCYLEKVNGFISLYQRMAKEGTVTYLIPSTEMLRFSHRVPSTKLTGTKRQGVPVGSFEFDPAALPNPDDFLQSTEPKSSAQASDINANPRNDEVNPSKARITSLSYDGLRPKDEVIYDFKRDKALEMFKRGQIWALYNKESGFPDIYAQIKKVEPTRSNVHASLLQPRTSTQLVCCGIFEVLAGKPKFYSPLSFSHKMDLVYIDNNKVEVYPRRGEVWAIYKNWTAGMAKENGKYEIIEVFQSNEDSISAWVLTYYGFKSVFKHQRGGRMRKIVLEIPRAELSRFSHQIPAFRLTGERDGFLRGFWELDPAAVPPDVYGRKNDQTSITKDFGQDKD